MRDGAAICSHFGGRRVRRGWKFRCPSHVDPKPSCVLRDDGLVTCFAGCRRLDVMRALDAAGFPDDGTGFRAPDAATLRKTRDEAAAEGLAAWEECLADPRSMDVVRHYLRSRRIEWEPDPLIMRRYGVRGFAVAVTDETGEITGMQYRLPGERGITRGWLGDGAARLTPVDRVGEELGLAEGTENALSATQLTGVPCWSVLGARRIHLIWLPPQVRRVVIFADNDGTGVRVEESCKKEYLGTRGLEFTMWPPPDDFKDWNDVVTGSRTRALRERSR